MHEVKIPKLGSSTIDVDLKKWLIAVGETVTPERIVAEVESEKTVVEITAGVAGTVVEILVPEGEVTAVGAAICRIDEQG